MSKDATYCFYCFLFRKEAGQEKFGHEVFSKTRYENWKQTSSRGFPDHCLLLMVATIKQGNVMMTLEIKGQMCHEKFESNSIDSEK